MGISQQEPSVVSGGTKSVLNVKKRDKKNMMENLVRINNQREEDSRNERTFEEEDSQDRKIDFEKRIRELKEGKGRRKFRVPGERMEERLRVRKNRGKELDKWGVKSVPRKPNRSQSKRLYYFKNSIEEEKSTKLNGVTLELLHTDELMAYYKELIAKGNRDFTEHQRLQNEIKKLEYQNVISPRSPKKGEHKSKSKSKSPTYEVKFRKSPGQLAQKDFQPAQSKNMLVNTPEKDKKYTEKLVASPINQNDIPKTSKPKNKKLKSKTPMLGRKTQAY